MILAVIPGPAVRQMEPSALRGSVAAAHASSRHMAQGVGVQVDSAALRSTAVENRRSAQQMSTDRTGRRATTIRPSVSPGSVKHTTTNASTTLAQVSSKAQGMANASGGQTENPCH